MAGGGEKGGGGGREIGIGGVGSNRRTRGGGDGARKVDGEQYRVNRYIKDGTDELVEVGGSGKGVLWGGASGGGSHLAGGGPDP